MIRSRNDSSMPRKFQTLSLPVLFAAIGAITAGVLVMIFRGFFTILIAAPTSSHGLITICVIVLWAAVSAGISAKCVERALPANNWRDHRGRAPLCGFLIVFLSYVQLALILLLIGIGQLVTTNKKPVKFCNDGRCVETSDDGTGGGRPPSDVARNALGIFWLVFVGTGWLTFPVGAVVAKFYGDGKGRANV